MAKVIKIEEKEGRKLGGTWKLYYENVAILCVSFDYGIEERYSKEEIERGGFEHGTTLEGCLDIDKAGRVYNMEFLAWPPNKWIVDPNLKKPEKIIKGEVYLAEDDFYDDLDTEEWYTNEERDILYIKFREEEVVKSVAVAEDLIFDITPTNKLGGIWILNLRETLEIIPEMK